MKWKVRRVQTCAWIRLFWDKETPDCVPCAESDPVQVSFLWTTWVLTRDFASALLHWELSEPSQPWPCILGGIDFMPLLCLSIKEGHAVLKEGSSLNILCFPEYLSLARYNSILCLSTALMSSLIYLRSVCICKKITEDRLCVTSSVRNVSLWQTLWQT